VSSCSAQSDRLPTYSPSTSASCSPTATAGPTPDHQRPVGESGRREPRSVDVIVDAELQAALAEPDPLRAIAGLVTR
jgi:hypothetical protein